MDLTGGMDPSQDEIAPVPPSEDYLEGANMWLWDDGGQVGLPRIAVDAMGARWDEAHAVSVNLTLPDGRVFVVRDTGTPHPVADGQGRPRVLGAGGLRLECLEPFERWRLTFDGLADETTSSDQIANRAGPRQPAAEVDRVPVRIEIDTRMAVAPWVLGTYEPDGATLPTEHRIEQLFRAEGTVEVAGQTIPFRGGGTRIHRKGMAQRSDYSDWMGHVWMSALFLSGRAFGIDNFHPRPDGSVRFHEGWLLDDGEILAAKFVDTPWKKDWVASGEDVSFTLRTSRGDVQIEAETVMTTVNPLHVIPGRPTFPSTQQGITRFRWDGEEAFGMMERSSPLEQPS